MTFQTFLRHSVYCILVLFFTACRQHVYNDAEDMLNDKIADSIYVSGQRQAAVAFLDSVYAGKDVSPLGRIFIYARKVQYYYEAKDLGRSMLYNDSAIALIRNNKLQNTYPKQYIHALLEKGHIFGKSGKYDSAYKAFLDGYQFVVTRGEPCNTYEFDYFMGMTMFRQGNKAKARVFFERSFLDARACSLPDKPWYRMQELLDNIALCYPADSGGIRYFDSCLSFIQLNKDKFPNKEMVAEALSVCLKNKGIAHQSVYRAAEAKKCFLQAIDVYVALDSNKYRDLILERKLQLAATMYYADDTPAVYQLWRELSPIAEKNENSEIKKHWLQMNFMYYDFKADFKNAYQYYVAYNNYIGATKVPYSDLSKKDVIQDMKNLEQGYHIQLLTKEKQLQRVYLWIFILLFIIAITATVFIYRSYKRTRISNHIIQQQKAELESSNKEKDAILNVVAHDLRNPIGNIAFIADMMLMEGGSSLPAGEAFKMIMSSSSGALKLVDELLQVARNDKQGLKKERVDICQLAHNVVAGMQYKASEKAQLLICNTPSEAIPINIDKEKMARVLENLLANAIKFTHNGGQIGLVVSTENSQVLVKVTDNGIGIPASLLPGIFDIFSGARRTGTANERSYGLGLSICKQIVEEHGGTISVTSKEGNGTTFTILLPGA